MNDPTNRQVQPFVSFIPDGTPGEGATPNTAIKQQLQQMAADATSRCGLSYDVFQQSFSRMVDAAFPVSDVAIALAREMGYLTPKELEQAQEDMAAHGYCSHGLDPDCCPCGCGDI